MRTKSTRVVQHSRTLLRSWRANCDIKLLLYFSDPNLPDIGEIEEVCRYVVAYTAKKHSTARSEKEAIHNLIMRWVKKETTCNLDMWNFAHSSFRSTGSGNMGGTRLLTQKTLHTLSSQRTVSYQEASHMIDQQDLVVSSDSRTSVCSKEHCCKLTTTQLQKTLSQNTEIVRQNTITCRLKLIFTKCSAMKLFEAKATLKEPNTVCWCQRVWIANPASQLITTTPEGCS